MTKSYLHHAITYALNAIEEHLKGGNVNWHDVINVLKNALEEAEMILADLRKARDEAMMLIELLQCRD